MTSRVLASLVLVATATASAQPVPPVEPPPPTPEAPIEPPTPPPEPAPIEPPPPEPAPPAPPIAPKPAAPVPIDPPPAKPAPIEPPPTTTPITDEAEGEPKLSLPTEADRAAWRTSGFRLVLAGGYGELRGLRGAPSGRLIAAKLRVGLRLDERWSVLASFEYAQAKRTRGLLGLRFLGTIDPTWHITPNLAVAVGFGFGGIVEGGDTGRPDPAPLASTLESSYTFPDASPPIPRCEGVGAAGLARVEYGFVLGPRTQANIALELSGQWTGCEISTNRFEPDSGEAIVRRQWWALTGVTLSAGFAWR